MGVDFANGKRSHEQRKAFGLFRMEKSGNGLSTGTFREEKTPVHIMILTQQDLIHTLHLF